jgi:hypothetical protein
MKGEAMASTSGHRAWRLAQRAEAANAARRKGGEAKPAGWPAPASEGDVLPHVACQA